MQERRVSAVKYLFSLFIISCPDSVTPGLDIHYACASKMFLASSHETALSCLVLYNIWCIMNMNSIFRREKKLLLKRRDSVSHVALLVLLPRKQKRK